MDSPRRRRGARMHPCHPVFFESSKHRGSATLSEASYSGAWLEVEQAGAVVGVREDGFAVEYEEPGQAICQWIYALQSAESAPPRKQAERPGAVG